MTANTKIVEPFVNCLFNSLQLGSSIIQSISRIGEYFNKLKLGFSNFPKRISKVMKTFQHYFIFNNLNFFSPIAKSFQQFCFRFKQFSFRFKEFCLLLFLNCKCFQHSRKQLYNLQNVIPAIHLFQIDFVQSSITFNSI